jgi:hypothetical protein
MQKGFSIAVWNFYMEIVNYLGTDGVFWDFKFHGKSVG